MASFKKTIATAKAKVADAETKAFMARLEAIDAILEDASADDVLWLAAHALADIAPDRCGTHRETFKAAFLAALDECIAINDAAEAHEAHEADEGDDTPARVH